MGLDRGRKPLWLAEARERQGSRDYLELEIRLAKETSWDVAQERGKVVQRNRKFVVPSETVVVVQYLRVLACSEELSLRRTISGVCW